MCGERDELVADGHRARRVAGPRGALDEAVERGGIARDGRGFFAGAEEARAELLSDRRLFAPEAVERVLAERAARESEAQR